MSQAARQPSREAVRRVFSDLAYSVKRRPDGEALIREIYSAVTAWRGERPTDTQIRRAAADFQLAAREALRLAKSPELVWSITASAHYASPRKSLSDIVRELEFLGNLADAVVAERKVAPRFRVTTSLHHFSARLCAILHDHGMGRSFTRFFNACAPLIGFPNADAKSQLRALRRLNPGRAVSPFMRSADEASAEHDFRELDTIMGSLGKVKRGAKAVTRTRKRRKREEMSA